ncbi:TetR/AcrR family transcriptional regulator [Stenotrophomonas sp. MMGLT7]|uniref:TetR/AcrR family transcriptional regulator n=1 Tax=Stenotrophomonas sp. MMGLT7 TaxID=2901227 RepID=UPI001E4A7214|nr:TetR/AcrR family transcriptional regulator [Stenotrophomonas sp. MMGLT7]MCD7097916.1 TetR/AcrR family transcriptional regulator [Stenotrophomonas sp. MMGLT7]
MKRSDAVPRQTQAERSEKTRNRLLLATLECLGELGFAGTTVSSICARSRLSRGALLHHFPSKNALIVDAFMHRQRLRLDELQQAVSVHGARQRSVREEIDATRSRMSADFSVSQEFFNALRTDATLQAEFAEFCARQGQVIAGRYVMLNSELDHVPAPLATRYVIGCFVRGLCLEALASDAATVESAYEQFVAIMQCFHDVTATDLPAGSSPPASSR